MLNKHASAVRAALSGQPNAHVHTFYITASGKVLTCQGVKTHSGALVVDLKAVNGTSVQVPQITFAPYGWKPAPGGPQLEPVAVDSQGSDIFQKVNTNKYKMELTCNCGRVRYATANNTKQVKACRICTKQHRHDYRVSWQQQKRKSQSSTQKKESKEPDVPNSSGPASVSP